MLVDCVACGHDWVEGMALPAAPECSIATADSMDNPARQGDPHPLIEAARGAQTRFNMLRRARRSRAAAWACLATLALAPFIGGAIFPEQVVAAIPVSIRAYDWIGQDVNLYGLEVRQIDLQHLVIDGRRVIAVRGELANVSSTARKIPWLRFGLRSKDNTEVYHWMLDTEIRTLKPGESTSFVTRLASPPEAAQNVEIRFAHADEIGSDNSP